jgi:hypothetical protein
MLEPVRFGYAVVTSGERRLDGSMVPYLIQYSIQYLDVIASEGGKP